MKKRLFYDIETSPNIGFFWRPGYNQSIQPNQIIWERDIICISWKWAGEEEVHSLDWTDGQEIMLKKFINVLNQSDEAIAHNGDKFDIKWIRGMALSYDIPMSPTTKTVDTLKIARKYFGLNSYRLDYIGKYLFGEGKIKTSYDMWKDLKLDATLNKVFGSYLEKITDSKVYDLLGTLEKSAEVHLKDMVLYCEEDVRLLEKVYDKMRTYSTNYTHFGVLSGKEKWTCPECGSPDQIKSKTRVTAKGVKQHQLQCKDCGQYHTVSEKVWSDLLKFRGDI